MKILAMLALLVISFKMSLAQSGYFEYKGRDINHFLGMQIRPMPEIMEYCKMPFTYVKFKISKDNTVDSLIITNNNYPQVKDEITRVILLTGGHWNLEKTRDKWFVIPIIFYTDFNDNKDKIKSKGCDFVKILADQNREMENIGPEIDAVYFPMVTIVSRYQ